MKYGLTVLFWFCSVVGVIQNSIREALLLTKTPTTMEHPTDQLEQTLKSVIFRQKLRDAETKHREKEDKLLLIFEIVVSILLLPFLLPIMISCLAFVALRWLYRKTALSMESTIRRRRKYLRSCKRKATERIREDMHIFITAILLLALYGGIIWWLANKPL